VQLLPIDPLLPDVIATLTRAARLVLRAPPGAGKTTRVPAALLDAGLAGGKEVLVLEPRRIAARAAAEFVAHERGGSVGDEIGYRVRFEQRGGAATRLWFVTEGVLGRQLARDPFLEHAGIVILDEFHERHLQGDVALAVIRELQETVRPDLKLVVMSATLQTERLSSYLADCPVLTSEGRAFPVEVEYDTARDDRPLSARVAAALGRVLTVTADTGDILVFLPGSAEIRRVAAAIDPIASTQNLAVVLLHGDLPLQAQQQAIRRGPCRKVVLSTNVAETALTIEGVTTVIDSGLARVAWFDTRHGINALRVMPISRAAADQRAGRAGRTAPGRCVRLWTRAEQDGRRPYEVPEILRLDLAATVLELRAWGLGDPRQLRWLEPPAEAVLQRAEQLLTQLGAVEDGGVLTAIGRNMLGLSASPRLARMLIEAQERGCAEAGALLAALASERDICREQRAFGAAAESRWATGPSDLLLRLQLFVEAARTGFDVATCRALDLDPASVRAVERTRRQLLQAAGTAQEGPRNGQHGASASPENRILRLSRSESRLKMTPERSMQSASADLERLSPGIRFPGGRTNSTISHFPARSTLAGTAGDASGADEEDLLRCVLAGFPDRLVRRRESGSPRGVMVGGTGVVLASTSVVRQASLFVAVEVQAGHRGQLSEARVWLASAVEQPWLKEMFPAAMRQACELIFDPERGRVVERTRELFFDLVLEESIRLDVDRPRAGEVLAAAVRVDPGAAVQLGDSERSFVERVRFLHRTAPELGFPEDAGALVTDAAVSLCAGRRSLQEIRAADLMSALQRSLTPSQRHALDIEAPEHYRLPTGRRVPIHYEPDKSPAFSARIQEVFGLTATPRLARGRVAVVIELLGPNHRPVQITDDLASFWRHTYPKVRKQLRGRYPKHQWPDDPLRAAPAGRVQRDPKV